MSPTTVATVATLRFNPLQGKGLRLVSTLRQRCDGLATLPAGQRLIVLSHQSQNCRRPRKAKNRFYIKRLDQASQVSPSLSPVA